MQSSKMHRRKKARWCVAKHVETMNLQSYIQFICGIQKKGTAESEIKVDQNTGEVDMSNWQRKHRDGGDENCRFDYAYYDGCGNFFHADGIHNPDENNDGEGDIFKRKQIACMTVLKADLGEWQGSMRDAYNQEVWCVACGGWIVAGKNDPRIDHSKIKPVKPQN